MSDKKKCPKCGCNMKIVTDIKGCDGWHHHEVGGIRCLRNQLRHVKRMLSVARCPDCGATSSEGDTTNKCEWCYARWLTLKEKTH